MNDPRDEYELRLYGNPYRPDKDDYGMRWYHIPCGTFAPWIIPRCDCVRMLTECSLCMMHWATLPEFMREHECDARG